MQMTWQNKLPPPYRGGSFLGVAKNYQNSPEKQIKALDVFT